MNPQGRRSRPGEGDFWQIPMLNLISTKVGADYLKLAHGVLYVILGRYFGMISQNFGMKIYHYLPF